jgi:hypothetical protein
MPDWNPTTKSQFIGFTIGLAGLIALILKCELGFVPILDSANLVFHEAGHPIFGLLGDTMNLYGGTLGQLAIPLIVIGAFWQQGNPVAVAVGGVWFFENFFNIARYVADAREQILPLVGGGEHDWFNILTRWDALEHDTKIARFITIVGWTGIAFVWAWLAWRCYRDHSQNFDIVVPQG